MLLQAKNGSGAPASSRVRGVNKVGKAWIFTAGPVYLAKTAILHPPEDTE